MYASQRVAKYVLLDFLDLKVDDWSEDIFIPKLLPFGTRARPCLVVGEVLSGKRFRCARPCIPLEPLLYLIRNRMPNCVTIAYAPYARGGIICHVKSPLFFPPEEVGDNILPYPYCIKFSSTRMPRAATRRPLSLLCYCKLFSHSPNHFIYPIFIHYLCTLASKRLSRHLRPRPTKVYAGLDCHPNLS